MSGSRVLQGPASAQGLLVVDYIELTAVVTWDTFDDGHRPVSCTSKVLQIDTTTLSGPGTSFLFSTVQMQ